MEYKIVNLPVPGIESFEVGLPIGTSFLAIDIKEGIPQIIARVPISLSEIVKTFKIVVTRAKVAVKMSENAHYLGTLSAVAKSEIVGVQGTSHTFYFFVEEAMPKLS